MYCHICGNEFKDNNNFCSKCGTKRKVVKAKKVEVQKNEEMKIEKEKTPFDSSKLILIVGVFLVLFSSFLFGIISWNNLSEIFKISFFGVECIFFYIFSILLKSVENKLSRLFMIISLVLLPYTL